MAIGEKITDHLSRLIAAFFNLSIRIFTCIKQAGEYFLHSWSMLLWSTQLVSQKNKQKQYPERQYP